MAGEWIMMRVWLAKDHHVVAMANHISLDRSFINWVCDYAHATCKETVYEYVSSHVVRSVTVTALLQIWGVANEQGKLDGDDLVMDHLWVSDLDEIGGVPGIGEAMEAVGWVIQDGEHDQKDTVKLRFPKFKSMNTPVEERKKKAAAERQRKKRQADKSDKKRDMSHEKSVTVTEMSRVTERDKSVTVTPRVLSSLLSSSCISSSSLSSSSEREIEVCAQEEEKPEQQKQEPTVSIPFEWREGVHEDWEAFADAHQRLFPKWVRPDLSDRLGDWSRAHAKYGLVKLVRALEWLAGAKKTEFTRGHMQNIPVKYLFRNLADCIESSQSAAGWEAPADSEDAPYDPIKALREYREQERQAASGA